MVTEARINFRIRAKEVRAIDVDGKQLGVLPLAEAIKVAQQRELDLVEVAPGVVPPVCRVMDYGKYRYEQTKREKETHKQHQSGKLKELRIRPFIENHDYNVKLEQAKEFLHKKCKVKLSMFFRGREIVHKNSGMEVLNKFINDLNEFGAVESPPKTLGKMVLVTLGPVSAKHSTKKKEDVEAKSEGTVKTTEQQTIKKTDTQNQ